MDMIEAMMQMEYNHFPEMVKLTDKEVCELIKPYITKEAFTASLEKYNKLKPYKDINWDIIVPLNRKIRKSNN